MHKLKRRFRHPEFGQELFLSIVKFQDKESSLLFLIWKSHLQKDARASYRTVQGII